ncbi:Bug family tripartite tricarboxylate transporter substrate binding protein [Pseudogemmobacter sonorensis]|uniref:Bug family tripartite tricarboxylate transporter substrate binding protein n=1 Tax=Pseudogemmobacter sonorensis TaxID=2989681 RepID=UPI00368460DD
MTHSTHEGRQRRRVLAGMALGLCALALPATQALAQDYPTRPITLVSPYQAGGAADSIGRAVAAAASKHLGQPIVVEAKPGAEGLLGANDVRTSDPDGYRILWGGAGSMMLATALRKTPPFDPVTDFTPISGSVDFSFFLYVHPDVEADTMAEFIELVREAPGDLNYGTGNNQGLMTFSWLNQTYGLDMEHIAYPGEVAATTDLVPGRIQALFATTSALPHVREGNLKVLVTTLPQRSALLPDVPTMVEAGFDNVPFSPGGGWLGIFGPAGMDPAVVARLEEAFAKAYQDPAVQNQLEMLGLSHTEMTLAEFTDFVQAQRDQYRATIQDLGIPQVD